MIVRLELPYADVRAGDLVHVLGGALLPALETLIVEAGGVHVELRLLGCSHQAVVGGELVETVACLPGVHGTLPSARSERGYRFRARTECLSPLGYRLRAQSILDRVAEDPRALAGVFPGPDEMAFTALRVEAGTGGAAWSTWHGYPQTGELVVTRSRLGRD